ALNGFEHQALPFEHLLNALPLARNDSHAPLASVIARHQNIPEALQTNAPALSAEELKVSTFNIDGQTAKCELDFMFIGKGAELQTEVEYAADLFKSQTIERL